MPAGLNLGLEIVIPEGVASAEQVTVLESVVAAGNARGITVTVGTDPMTEQLAGVDQRGETIIVYSSSTTQVGFWIMNGWFRLLPEPADDESLGRSVIDALSQSRQGVPTPERSVVANAPILKSLGIRSQLAYMKGARHVDVIRHGSRLELRPNENLGRNGFIPISGAEIVSEVPGGEDAVSIGRAVRRALLAAKPGRPESAR